MPLDMDFLEDRTTPSITGAIYTTVANGSTVNGNIYDSKDLVYLNGGPQNFHSAGLPVGTYYFQVTDPSGKVLLSTDPAINRQVKVALNASGHGVISGSDFDKIAADGGTAPHANGLFNPANGSTTVQLIPYDNTPNNGGEYKVWLISEEGATLGDDPDPNTPGNQSPIILFTHDNVKTDNFKIRSESVATVINPMITGYKATDVLGNDSSNDPDRFNDDTPLANWTVYLYSGNTLIDTTTTDSNGFYQFEVNVPGATITNVASATYTVVEDHPAGWTETFGGNMSNDYYTVTVSSGIFVAPGDPGNVDPVGSAGNDFANFQNVTISGTKWEDHNGNGVRDGDDQGLPGWLILVNGVDTGVITDANGDYSFSAGPGTYNLQEAATGQPWSSFTETYGMAGYSVTPTSGMNSSGNDFGNFQNVTISGTKWEDHNGNGVRDGDDQGLPGWLILVNGVDTGVITDANGDYSFSAGPGTYTLQEAATGQPWSSFTETYGMAGYTVTPTSGMNSSGNDFGNFQNVTISGTKWEDHNGNGVRDGDDQGLPGWLILVNGVDTGVITDANGDYSFSAGPGTYTLQEAATGQPWSSFTETYGMAGYSVTPTSGMNSSGNDFGNFQNVTISGTKWEDHNGNGVRDGDDQGLPGWLILVNGVDTGVITDANGDYSFSAGPGTYTLQEAATGQPWSSFTETYGMAGYSVTPTSGMNSSGNDFGNFQNIVISGYKFYDTNTNGMFDGNPSEGKIPNWTIKLFDDVNGNGQFDGGDTLAQTTTTNSAGNYSFTVTYAGKFLVMESTTPPAGFTQTGWVPTTDVVQSTDALFSGATGSAIFGNVETGNGGGHTLGFWSNKNGKAAMGSTTAAMNETLAFLSGLNLRNANGTDFNPTTYDQFRTWILGATATNMSYMLSAQLAAMELNVRQGFVNGETLIYAPGATTSNQAGFATVNAIMTEANTELGLHGSAVSNSPYRSYQELLKNALDKANNNLTFVLAWHDINNNGVVDPGEIY